jgi:uncharacterized glyoxalase superfamily protein PhnB
MSVSPIPNGYHSIVVQLNIDGAVRAIEFYKQAFGAVVTDKADDPSGTKIWHAGLRIGDSIVFVNDVFPEMGTAQSHANLWLYVADVDATWKRAVDAGAKGEHPPVDMFWGDRVGNVVDPFGQKWALATRVKEMTPEEQKTAQDAFVAQMSKSKEER